MFEKCLKRNEDEKVKILRFFFFSLLPLVSLSLDLGLGDDYSQVLQGSSSGGRICRSYGNRVPQDERNLYRVAPRRKRRRRERDDPSDLFFRFENDQRAGTMRLMGKKKEKKKKKQHLHTRIDPTATDYNPVIRRREYDLRHFSLSSLSFLVFFSIKYQTRVKRSLSPL